MDKKLAEVIVREIMERLGKNINLMDRTGTIIASGDPSRIGNVHEGALEVIKTGKERIVINPEKGAKAYSGSKPGVNLSIKYRGEILGVVGITGHPEDVLEFASLVVMMAELLIERSIFESESERVNRTKNFLMEECLKKDPDLDHIQFKLKGLGLQLEQPYQLAILRVEDGKSRSHDTFSVHNQIRNRLIELPVLYQFVNDRDFVFLLISQPFYKFDDILSYIINDFKNHFRHVQVGLPQAFNELKEARFHFKRTIQTLDMTNEERVVPEQFESQLLISKVTEDYGDWFVENRLRNLPSNLIKTLMVYFDHDLNMSQTAKQLFVHRNTLIYRLDRVKEIVGLDPRQFKDAVELQLAIWLYCTKNKGSF